jgi:hypothetical protein
VRPVAYTRENIDKCWCGGCPVQARSRCARDLYQESLKEPGKLPPPERLGGMYCSTGKAICDDIDAVALCNCPGCLVWSENGLSDNHYCLHGSAEEVGR